MADFSMREKMNMVFDTVLRVFFFKYISRHTLNLTAFLGTCYNYHNPIVRFLSLTNLSSSRKYEKYFLARIISYVKRITKLSLKHLWRTVGRVVV